MIYLSLNFYIQSTSVTDHSEYESHDKTIGRMSCGTCEPAPPN